MSWQQASETPPSARIASLLPSLLPTERKVGEAIMADRHAAVEHTAQELANAVGVSRSTVIRTAQALGYNGFPQLRVAIAQELALESNESAGSSDTSLLGAVREGIMRFGAQLPMLSSALTEEGLTKTLKLIDASLRVLVVANGLSGPLGLDLVQRLNSAGRSAEMMTDGISQQIIARQLGPESLCIVFSGSGANRTTLDTIRAAKQGGAKVIALTSFARSAVAELADIPLVVPPANATFHNELVHTSRASLMLLSEQLVDLFVAYRGERGREARLAAMSLIGDSLEEGKGRS